MLLRSVGILAVAATLVIAVLLAVSPAVRAGGESRRYAKNLERLERMTATQRIATWERYQEFLSLPQAEQDRIRRLHAGLDALSPVTRDRYMQIMAAYRKWRDALPLYEQQQLEDAAARGSGDLYTEFRRVQKEQELADQKRDYWLLPANPVLRAALPKILTKLTPDQIEQLDQTSPLDRVEKLIEYAQQFDLNLPLPPRMPQPRWRGNLPAVDPEKLLEFRRSLSRQQLEELSDLGARKNVQLQRLLQWYYDAHPTELPESRREMGPRNDRQPKSNTPGSGRTRPGGDRMNESNQPGEIGIRKSDNAP